ncbi:MAG TPA: hypothetical protein V6D28_21990 [Leptolyngbyaceae cyanobacterium]
MASTIAYLKLRWQIGREKKKKKENKTANLSSPLSGRMIGIPFLLSFDTDKFIIFSFCPIFLFCQSDIRALNLRNNSGFCTIAGDFLLTNLLSTRDRSFPLPPARLPI